MDKQQTFMRERGIWVAVFERKEGLLRAEDALDNDFCDRFVQKSINRFTIKNAIELFFSSTIYKARSKAI